MLPQTLFLPWQAKSYTPSPTPPLPCLLYPSLRFACTPSDLFTPPHTLTLTSHTHIPSYQAPDHTLPLQPPPPHHVTASYIVSLTLQQYYSSRQPFPIFLTIARLHHATLSHLLQAGSPSLRLLSIDFPSRALITIVLHL